MQRAVDIRAPLVAVSMRCMYSYVVPTSCVRGAEQKACTILVVDMYFRS